MRTAFLTRATALCGAVLIATSPAMAGDRDRARSAIAEANGKIEAVLQIQAGGDVPTLRTEAQAALREAREQFGRGKEQRAITAAMRASELADRALAESQKAQVAATSSEQNAQVTAAAALDAAAAANARAEAAESAAARAAAEAAAARSQLATVPAATVTTRTVTTPAVTSGAGTVRRKAPATKRPVARRSTAPAAAANVTTTTTVTTPR